MADAATTLAVPAFEGDALATLPEPVQRATRALMATGRVKDAAAAAGVTPSRIWAWRAAYPAVRAALEARYARLADAESDTLDAALARATAPEAEGQDLDRGIRAAALVQRGLGIGLMGAFDTRARIAVAVHLDISAIAPVLRLDAVPTLDVTTATADALPQRVTLELPAPALAHAPTHTLDVTPDAAPAPPAVAVTQPRRARSASRKARPDRTA